ncbi:MAG: hypothetical protein JSR57_07905 [Verrucomicrobia bacterium]|nr:hypothetical protein [Verrucomicrobiota bacterium]
MSHLSIDSSKFSEAVKAVAIQPLDPSSKKAEGHSDGQDKASGQSLQKPALERSSDREPVQKEDPENKSAPVEVRLPEASEHPEGSHPLSHAEEQSKPEQTSSSHVAPEELSVDDQAFSDLLNHAIDAIDASGIDASMETLSSHISELIEKSGGDFSTVLDQLFQHLSGLDEKAPEEAMTKLPETDEKSQASVNPSFQKVIESPHAASLAPKPDETTTHEAVFAAAPEDAAAANPIPAASASSSSPQVSEGSLMQALSQNAGATAAAMTTAGTTMSSFSQGNISMQQGEAANLEAASKAAAKALNHLLHEGFWEKLWQKIEKPFFKIVEACILIAALATGRIGLAVMVITVAIMSAHSSQIGSSIAKDLMKLDPNMSKQKAEAIGSGIATAIVAITAVASGQLGAAFESAPEAAASVIEKTEEEAKTVMAKIGKVFSAIGGALQTINPFRYIPTYLTNLSYGMARGWSTSHLTTNILNTVTFNDPSQKAKVEAIVYSVTIFVDLVVTAGTLFALMEKPVGASTPNSKLFKTIEAVKYVSGMGAGSAEIGEAVPNGKSAVYTKAYAHNQELIKNDQYLLNTQSEGNKSNVDVNSKIISNFIQMLNTLATAPAQGFGAFAQDMIA